MRNNQARGRRTSRVPLGGKTMQERGECEMRFSRELRLGSLSIRRYDAQPRKGKSARQSSVGFSRCGKWLQLSITAVLARDEGKATCSNRKLAVQSSHRRSSQVVSDLQDCFKLIGGGNRPVA